MPSGMAFSRVGLLRVPVSLTSASNPFEFPASLVGKSNLFFEMVNLTPYDLRLEGTTADQMANGGFRPVTANSGWPLAAYMSREPRVSKMPVRLSAAVFSTPGNPVSANTDFTDCFLDLIYLERV